MLFLVFSVISQKNILVSKFVGALVRDAAASDPLKSHNVVLLKSGGDTSCDVFDLIAQEVGRSTAVISFDNPQSVERPIKQPVSMIICVVDAMNGVFY